MGIRKRFITRHRLPEVESAALRAGYTPLQAQLLAGRLPSGAAARITRHTSPTLADLDAPGLLPDIEVGTERVVQAIIRREPLIVCSDHDCDGQAGGAIVRAALIDWFGHPPPLVHSYIGHRMREGYGVSEGVTQRILTDGHHDCAMITVDVGSADEQRIAELKQQGIVTVVTDHHELSEYGPPPSALATINPIREDASYPDPLICGGYTAWLLMASVRRELMRRGHLTSDAPHITELLDYAATATVADVVSLSRSPNNRAVVNHGLMLINNLGKPCWQALHERLGIGPEGFSAETIAFKVAPLLNAGGRLSDGLAGLRFLRAPSLAVAHRELATLTALNEERKEIGRAQLESARARALEMAEAGAAGIAIWLPNGHAGTHGVTASRLVEITGRPTVCLSPVQDDPTMATGSARSIRGVHVRQAFDHVQAHHPGCLERAGGHAGAGGLRLQRANISRFVQAWDEAVAAQIEGRDLAPEILTDGAMPATPSLAMLAEIEALAPFGREFEPPVFTARLRVLRIKVVGQGGTHLKLDVEDAFGARLPAIWFGAIEDGVCPVQEQQWITCAVVPSANTFRGNTTVQLRIEALASAEEITEA